MVSIGSVGAPSVPSERLRAAWMMIEPGVTAGERLREGSPAVVTHRSAAWLHGLGDVDADVMEFATSKRRQSRLSDVRYRVASYERDEWTLEDGLPVTTVLMTIVDLASGHLDGGHLAGGIVRDAVVANRVDSESVSEALRPFAHMYGGVRLGDGEALLSRFLEEAGIPQSTRALGQRLAGQGVLDLPNSAFVDLPALQSLRDTVALMNSPALQSFRDSLALVNSPAMHSVRDAEGWIHSPVMQSFRDAALVNSEAMQSIWDAAALMNSPAMQSLRDAAAAVDLPVVEAARKIADSQRRAQ